jgi:hypothetical protein
MKINFGRPAAPDSTPLEPEDNDGLADPSATKRSRQEEESSNESPEKISTALARVRNPSAKSGEYSDLPNTTVATVPEDQLKPAGSGLSNSSLSHLQQWLSSTKHNAELQMRKAQDNFKAIEAPGKKPFKKMEGIRFQRVYDDKKEESNARIHEPKKFHTSIPFNYNQRGAGPPTRGFIERGRGGLPGRGGIRFDIRGRGQNTRGGPQQGFTFRGNNNRGRFQSHGGPPNRGGPPARGVPPVRGMPFPNQRGFPNRGHPQMRGDSFRGHSRGQSSRGEFARGRGNGHSSRGGPDTGYSRDPPQRESFEDDNRPRYGMAPNPRHGRSLYTNSNMPRGSGSYNKNHGQREDFSRGGQRDNNPSSRDARPNSTRNVPRFDDGKIECPMGRSGPQSSAYDQLLQDVDKHREISKKKKWEDSKLDRDIEAELRRTQKKSEPVMLGEVRVAKPETFGKW